MRNPPLESRIVKKVMTVLRSRGGFWIKIHGSPLQIAGIPDILGCYRGRFVALEVKRPGNQATKLQLYTMGKIKAAGGVTALIYSTDDALVVIGRIDGSQEAETRDLN